jgi:uncharacterized membrane protein YqjE
MRSGLEDERNQLIKSIATTVLSVFFVAFGCMLAVAALVLVLPEAWRAVTAASAALLFWLLAGCGLWALHTQRQQRRRHLAMPSSPH